MTQTTARLLGALMVAIIFWANIALASTYLGGGVTVQKIDAWHGRWRVYFSFRNDKPVLYIEFGCSDSLGSLNKITVYPPRGTRELNWAMTCRVKDPAKTTFFIRAYVYSQRQFRVLEYMPPTPYNGPQVLGGWGVMYPGLGVGDVKPRSRGCYLQTRENGPIIVRPEGEQWIVGPGDVYVCRNGRWHREFVSSVPFENVLLTMNDYARVRDTRTAIALFTDRDGGQVRVEDGCPVVRERGDVEFVGVGSYISGYRCIRDTTGYRWIRSITYTRTPRRG